jgi:hypothetical protein
MAKPRRFDVVNLFFDVGEIIQEAEDSQLPGVAGLYMKGYQRIHASKSPSFLPGVKWKKAEMLVDEDGEETTLPVAEPASTEERLAHIIQRRKKEVAVAGAGAYALATIMETHKGVLPAVAFTFRDVTRAGILPNGEKDYGEQGYSFTAAFRTGGEEYGVGIAAWLPSERMVIAPKDNLILGEHVSENQLPESFPGTPLV